MMGISARRVVNRVRRISVRLASRKFLDAARALHYLPRGDVTLARLRFCAGLSERKLAEKLGVSPHVIRRQLDRIGAQIATIRRMRSGRGGLQIAEGTWVMENRRGRIHPDLPQGGRSVK